MPFQPGATNYTQAFGSRPENVEVPHIDIRAPATTDILYPIGKKWIDTIGNATYELTSLSTSGNISTANWVTTGGGSGSVSTLSGNTGTASPVAGNIRIAGTPFQIATTATASTVTLSLPSTVIFPGSVVVTGTLEGSVDIIAGTTLTAEGDITATNGNFVKGTAGNKDIYVSVATGPTAGDNSAGTITLIGGTATVSTTAVTANSLIRLSRQSIGATGAAATGNISRGAVTPGVFFEIRSVSVTDASVLATTDVSVVFWEIVN